jgi:TRAP-type C4-dicarboxylate transport system permease small subunit
MMLRRGLDALYLASAGLAALSLLGIFLVMMAQVVLREFGRQLPGADDISAYLCVATTFYALAFTFRRGELIRVGLLLERLAPGPRRAAEALALLLAAAMTGYATWWVTQDMLFSLEIEEVAQGTVPFLLWVPKTSMVAGSAILLIAILDELWTVLRGGTPAYVAAAAERAARGDFSAEV